VSQKRRALARLRIQIRGHTSPSRLVVPLSARKMLLFSNGSLPPREASAHLVVSRDVPDAVPPASADPPADRSCSPAWRLPRGASLRANAGSAAELQATGETVNPKYRPAVPCRKSRGPRPAGPIAVCLPASPREPEARTAPSAWWPVKSAHCNTALLAWRGEQPQSLNAVHCLHRSADVQQSLVAASSEGAAAAGVAAPVRVACRQAAAARPLSASPCVQW